MGSYAQLTIDGYPLTWDKNGYNPLILELVFQKEDFIEEKRRNSSRSTLIWGDVYKDDNEEYLFTGFTQTAAICKKRLELFGTNLKTARRDFDIAKKMDPFPEYDVIYDFPIRKVSYKQYLNELASILSEKEITDEQEFYNLKSSLITLGLGIAGQTLESTLYSVLSTVSDTAVVEYDLSDVIEGGYVNTSNVCSINSKKILILTEGKTDSEFIQKSMLLCNPELYPYYHFIDFSEYKVEGGASALVKLVTALAGANIEQHIIAIFDNDTAGLSEMGKLKKLKLSNSIRVLRYPDLRYAKRYPTIGPNGSRMMNVNGLACSIEMYFGEDVLKENGRFLPVRWMSYSEKEDKYQGVISNKETVQNRFKEKLGSGHIGESSGMHVILNQIYRAFQTEQNH